MDVALENAKTSVELFQQDPSKCSLRRLLLSARVLGIAAGVRKGTRVKTWTGLLMAMASALKAITKHSNLVLENEDMDVWNYPILSISIAFQYAPMDTLITFISPFMDSLTKDPLMTWFLTFCSYFSEVDADSIFLLPYVGFGYNFMSFIVDDIAQMDDSTIDKYESVRDFYGQYREVLVNK